MLIGCVMGLLIRPGIKNHPSGRHSDESFIFCPPWWCLGTDKKSGERTGGKRGGSRRADGQLSTPAQVRCHFIKGLTRVQLQFRTVRVPWHPYRRAYRDDTLALRLAGLRHPGSEIRHRNIALTDPPPRLLRCLIVPIAVTRSHWVLPGSAMCLPEDPTVHPQGEVTL